MTALSGSVAVDRSDQAQHFVESAYPGHLDHSTYGGEGCNRTRLRGFPERVVSSKNKAQSGTPLEIPGLTRMNFRQHSGETRARSNRQYKCSNNPARVTLVTNARYLLVTFDSDQASSYSASYRGSVKGPR